ncbi:MAG: YdeI/OmpD-associated family protein [Chloroflexota bacterium]
MSYTFTTVVAHGGKDVTGLPVPEEAVAAMGKGRNPKVKVTLNGHTYRGTVQVTNGRFMVSLSLANRQAAGVEAGQQVEVTIELDTESRRVEIPGDLAAALTQKPGAMEEFDTLADSRRKEFVRQVEEAKAQETRDRRIAGIVAKMGNS